MIIALRIIRYRIYSRALELSNGENMNKCTRRPFNGSTVGRVLFSFCVALLATSVPIPANANLVGNGSLEDLNGNFVNTNSNYMSLIAGNTAIAGWTVAAATTNEIVWGKSPTGDGINASDGTFFVDLTGFGSDSPDGAVQQILHNLIVGQQYAFSLDSSGSLPAVTVGAVVVALSPGAGFTVGATIWTPETGNFIADATDPMLTIMNATPGSKIVFIDNIIVTGATSAAPEPASLALLALGLGALGFRKRKKARR